MNYNINTIQTNLLSVVGFNQPSNPNSSLLPTNLTTSLSGIKINDGFVPYLTLDNIKDLGENFSLYEYSEYNAATAYIIGNKIKYSFPTFSGATTYVIGQRVNYLGIGYESLTATNLNNTPALNLDKWKVLTENYAIYINIQNGTNKQPDLQPLFWTEKNLFAEFLETRLKASITNVVNKVVSTKNYILEQKNIFFGIGDGTQLIENTDNKIVGFKIDFIRNQNVKVKFNRIGLYFDSPITDLEVFLYNQNTKITSQKFTTLTNDFVWFDLTDFDLTCENGSYYIYYDQTGLIPKAVNNEICIPRNHSNFVRINQFEATGVTDLKTINDSNYVYCVSHIANIDYSVFPDLTSWITYNKLIFAEAIRLQFSLDIYKMFLENENVRSNRTERNIDLQTVKASIYTSDVETLNKQLNDCITDLRDAIGKAKIDNINLPTQGSLLNYGLSI